MNYNGVHDASGILLRAGFTDFAPFLGSGQTQRNDVPFPGLVKNDTELTQFHLFVGSGWITVPKTPEEILADQNSGSGIDVTALIESASGVLQDQVDVINAPEQNIFYVGKHGNNDNDGSTIQNAFFTFRAAVNAVNILASGGLIEFTEKYAIVCQDAGTYEDSFDLTIPDFTGIYAENATIVGNLVLSEQSTVSLNRQTAPSGDAVTMLGGPDGALYRAKNLEVTSLDGIGVHTPFGADNLSFVEIEKIFVGASGAAGVGVLNANANTIIDIGDIIMVGENTVGLFSLGVTATLKGRVNNITSMPLAGDSGGAQIGVWSSTSIVQIQANKISIPQSFASLFFGGPPGTRLDISAQQIEGLTIGTTHEVSDKVVNAEILRVTGQYNFPSTLGNAGDIMKVTNAGFPPFILGQVSFSPGPALGDLTDVSLNASASGQFLRHNGSEWVNVREEEVICAVFNRTIATKSGGIMLGNKGNLLLKKTRI